jgi:hypothetical protein
MPDVVYSSDEITVVGGPSSINVNVNSGTRGIRGSRIYSVPGDPRFLSTQELPSDLLEYDLAIVVDSASNEAFTIFQKVGSSPQEWEALPPLALNVFSTKAPVTFADPLSTGFGQTVVPVPVSNIFDLDEFTIDKFSLQYQIEDITGGNSYPVSSSVSLSIVPDPQNGVQNLVAVFKAIEFDGTSWGPVIGTRIVHAFLTVI